MRQFYVILNGAGWFALRSTRALGMTWGESVDQVSLFCSILAQSAAPPATPAFAP